MSQHTSTLTNEKIVGIAFETKFANPELAVVARAAEFRPRKSVARSILYEAASWLVIPAGVTFIVISLIVFELIFSPICRFHNIALPYFIANSLGRLGCGNNPILTPIYTVLKVSLLSGSYLIATSAFFRARRLAKRYRVSAFGSLSRDSRPPVLYLRSFATEVAANPDRRSQKTYEEDLALALNHIGPVVAIGEPNESLPLLGATRIYLKNDNWQENVERLMSISKLVVIHAGLSDGLIWEVGTAARKVEPVNLLISFLAWQDLDEVTKRARYKQFKECVAQALNESNAESLPLPDDIGNASFVAFGPDWKPELVEAGKWKKRFFNFSTSILMNETLRPVLKRRGLRLRRWKAVLYSLYMFWLLLGLLWFISIPLTFSQPPDVSANAQVTSQDSSFLDRIPRPLAVAIAVPLVLFFFSLPFAGTLVIIWLLANLLRFISNLLVGKRRDGYTSIKINE